MHVNLRGVQAIDVPRQNPHRMLAAPSGAGQEWGGDEDGAEVEGLVPAARAADLATLGC